jgi:hypothetical protein
MDKIKTFLNSTGGKIVLVVVGVGVGFFIGKKKKPRTGARRY